MFQMFIYFLMNTSELNHKYYYTNAYYDSFEIDDGYLDCIFSMIRILIETDEVITALTQN